MFGSIEKTAAADGHRKAHGILIGQNRKTLRPCRAGSHL